MSAEERLPFHQEHSGPVMEKLHAWLEAQFDERKVEPNSGLGTGDLLPAQPLGQTDAVSATSREPRWTTTSVERALKKAILHRKNSLFYKTRKGRRWATCS